MSPASRKRRATLKKGWLNRKLECNPVPTIWVDNEIDHIDTEKYFETALFIAPPEPAPITLIFTGGTAPFIRFRQYHHSRKLKQLKDGKMQMILKVPVNFETVNWILSFGSNVEVVPPKGLKEMLKTKLHKAF